MSEALGGRPSGPGARPAMAAVYARLVALLLLAAGLARACMILGITPGHQNFASLALAWRAGATTLVLVDLFAAVGLWVGAAWGPVMWVVALAVEVSMYTIFADIFGSYPARVAIHCGLFLLFLVLVVRDWHRAHQD